MILIFSVQLVASWWFPPSEDELYYWCWSQQLQLSYFDHAPMVAYLIRLSTVLFGDSVVAIRLPACLCFLGMGLLIGWNCPFPRWLVLIALAPLTLFGGMLMTPDSPLLLFWAAYVAWLNVLHGRMETGQVDWKMWVAGGMVLGLGGLSKYTMVLAVPAAFATFLFRHRWRAWIGGFVLHGIVALIMTSPVLIYNFQNDLVPLKFQLDHIAASGTRFGQFAPEFFASQLVLVGFIPFALLPWSTARILRHWEDPRFRVNFCLYAVPLAYFLYKAFNTRLEANWAAPCYVSMIPLIAFYALRLPDTTKLRRLTIASCVLPTIVTAFLIVHSIVPVVFVPPYNDRLNITRGKLESSRNFGEYYREHELKSPVFAFSYQWVSYCRYQGIEAYQVPGYGRDSFFTMPPVSVDSYENVLILHDFPLPTEFVGRFTYIEQVAMFAKSHRGWVDRPMRLYRGELRRNSTTAKR
jgi:4-amino-4-deoxy-L-arabinose transferase-like glycosyltransferase